MLMIWGLPVHALPSAANFCCRLSPSVPLNVLLGVSPEFLSCVVEQLLGLSREGYIDEDMWQLHVQARGLADDQDAHLGHEDRFGFGDGDVHTDALSSGDDGGAMTDSETEQV